MKRFLTTTVLTLCLFSELALGQGGGGGNQKGQKKPNSKEADTWTAAEYSGLRREKDLQSAMASKGFTWITGSPADNEKLSVGKNAQFFGFVALRYQSGRSANRGTLGRAMYVMASEEQRELMADATLRQKPVLEEWWAVREEVLTLLENHLYTGEPVDQDQLREAGERFSLLNSTVGLHEARAFARFEDLMTSAQTGWMDQWRADAESAGKSGNGIRIEAANIPDHSDLKQLEDLYAKAFSWLTGTPEDNEIIPIGQPAQFFGFVSIRHKSGHAASRGKISKAFFALLDAEQQKVIKNAVRVQMPVVRQFLEQRHLLLKEFALLRSNPDQFHEATFEELSRAMGRLEMEAARIEAEAYRQVRASMTEDQLAAALKMRGEYVIDDSQVAVLDMAERGATLSILCAGCHGAPGQHRPGMPGPTLDGMWDRPIASGRGFEFSEALAKVRNSRGENWTPELLDDYLAGPKRFAPGTKMEFQGLLKEEDRKALVEHLKRTR